MTTERDTIPPGRLVVAFNVANISVFFDRFLGPTRLSTRSRA
jgi:hypothetical protein